MNRVLVLCLFGLSASLLIDNVRALEGEGIVGGENAKLGDYPYQISLQLFGKGMCGGTILSDRYVITAAHCVCNGKGEFYGFPMKVVGGINDFKSKISTRVDVDVEKVYIPKEYDPTTLKRSIGDIAVLKLYKPLNIDSNPNLGKVVLGDPKKTYAGEKAVISGFGWNFVDVVFNPKLGISEEKNGGGYGKRRFAEVNVLSNAKCVATNRGLSDTHMCGMVVQRKVNEREGICTGDSGGPLVHGSNTLIGVVSTSPLGCREDRKSAVYTRVSSYLDFVNKAVKGVKDPEIRTINLRISA